jgi:hypothetical protein
MCDCIPRCVIFDLAAMRSVVDDRRFAQAPRHMLPSKIKFAW